MLPPQSVRLGLRENTIIVLMVDHGYQLGEKGKWSKAGSLFEMGTRVPLIAISAYSRRGHVDHTYYDHASISKFIEHNWSLPPISARSRDNLPNPVADAANPYVPLNRPAIGDLMNLFDFTKPPHA